MTLAVCDGCWREGDAPHSCAGTLVVQATDGMWAVACVCRVDAACRGNKAGIDTRVRVNVVAS